MSPWLDLIVIISSLSIGLNAVLAIHIIRNKKKSKPTQTYDVQCLLRDLTTGPALVKIEYLDRSDILLRSPRHGA